MILRAGLFCIATAVFMAALDLCRSKQPDRPCIFCGKTLSPPLYDCDHVLGDGRAIGEAPAISWR
jgi:hypothetical protein